MVFMKSIITKSLSIVVIITMLITVLCFGSGVSAVALTEGQNVIRINVDSDTFSDYQKFYCMIYDMTADEQLTSWMSKKAEMTQDGDSNTWSYDLDAHSITLDPEHTYSVLFAVDSAKAQTYQILIEDYNSARDYTAVFTELFTDEAFTSNPQYMYKWIGDYEFNVGKDIIRINADKSTFWEPIDRLYCQIIDVTENVFVIEQGRMTQEDSDTWYFDFGKHGIELDPKHTYTVSFTDGSAETDKLTIDEYNRADDYTAVFTGGFIYDDVSGMNRSEYKWSNDVAILYGDADCDGEVTILDAAAIQRFLAGSDCNRFNAKAADVDGEGLDIIDATFIQKYSVNKIDRFPVEGQLA